MSLKTRFIQAGTGLALAGFIASVNTQQAEAASWQPRTVSEIKAEIQNQVHSQDGVAEYTFAWGDTLWGISEATGISIDKLAQVNNIENSSMVIVGNSIYLSNDSSVVSVKDENNEVKSYDVSQEEVKETETPEEVKEQVVEQIAPQEETNQAEAESQAAETAQVEAQEETEEQAEVEIEETAAPEVQETLEEPQTKTLAETEEQVEVETEEAEETEVPAAAEVQETPEEPQPADTPAPQVETTQAAEEQAAREAAEAEQAAEEQAAREAAAQTQQASPSSSQQAAPSASGVIPIGESVMGSSYRYGGSTPAGFDCSGFTQWVFAKAGTPIPRSSAAQYSASTKVSNPRVGDLVFFGQGGRVTHVGIYAGNGNFLGSQSSTGVAYARVDDPYYWGQRFMGYGRF